MGHPPGKTWKCLLQSRLLGLLSALHTAVPSIHKRRQRILNQKVRWAWQAIQILYYFGTEVEAKAKGQYCAQLGKPGRHGCLLVEDSTFLILFQ